MTIFIRRKVGGVFIYKRVSGIRGDGIGDVFKSIGSWFVRNKDTFKKIGGVALDVGSQLAPSLLEAGTKLAADAINDPKNAKLFGKDGRNKEFANMLLKQTSKAAISGAEKLKKARAKNSAAVATNKLVKMANPYVEIANESEASKEAKRIINGKGISKKKLRKLLTGGIRGSGLVEY